MRKTLVSTSLATVTLLGGAAPALASPINNQSPNNGGTFVLSCPAPIGAVTVVAPPNQSPFTPGFVVGTRQRVIPYSLVFTVASGDETSVETFAKKGPVPADAVTCTVGPFSFADDSGGISTFSGVVVVRQVPGARG